MTERFRSNGSTAEVLVLLLLTLLACSSDNSDFGLVYEVSESDLNDLPMDTFGLTVLETDNVVALSLEYTTSDMDDWNEVNFDNSDRDERDDFTLKLPGAPDEGWVTVTGNGYTSGGESTTFCLFTDSVWYFSGEVEALLEKGDADLAWNFVAQQDSLEDLCYITYAWSTDGEIALPVY